MKPPKCLHGAALLLLAVFALGSVAKASWKEKVLYSFQGGTDGSTPAGGVVFDAAGNLYGATEQGGGSDCKPTGYCGTVFRLKPPAQKGGAWTETVLHVFVGVTSTEHDGADPGGGLVIDAAGNLYGTTAYGGSGNCVLVGIQGGCGTVFELEPPKTKGGAWAYKILYSLQGDKDGHFPWGDLVFDGAGNLYGATQFGGGYGSCDSPFYQYCGTVFEMSPPKIKGGKWTEKVLHSFAGIAAGKQSGDGANPNGGLVFNSKGAIYGTTETGGLASGQCGAGGCGTVFMLEPPRVEGGAWTEKVLDRFSLVNSGAAEPIAGVRFDRGGSLYGTTLGGGNSGSGTIFQLAPGSDGRWVERVLYRFRDGDDGGHPQSSLALDSKGDLYGTASGGGAVGNGTLFRLRAIGDSWAFATVYEYKISPDGAYPTGGLIFDRAGNLYGTTRYGGSGQACGNYHCGTVFEVQPVREVVGTNQVR
jgi:uncharacterized repeat protein (TIGR03803 family)